MSKKLNEIPPEMIADYVEQTKPEQDFYKCNRQGEPTAIKDYNVREYIKQNHPMFILGQVPWIYCDGVFVEDSSGTRLKKLIENYVYQDLRTVRTINRIYEYFIADNDLFADLDSVNRYPREWVPFVNGMYDPVHKCMIPHDPEYQCINQIPWEYYPEAEIMPEQGPVICKWLKESFPSIEDQKMLLQYAGLCLNRDTRFQKSLFLTGDGGTGKSTLINYLCSVIGLRNCSSITLENLNERFYPSQLFGKLVNTCADIRTKILKETDGFKKCIGEDLLQYERKGKDGFMFRSYARTIFSMNEVPVVYGESTAGYFRRLLILKMNNEVKQPDPELPDKLKNEIPFFLCLLVSSLEEIYQSGRLFESSNSKRAVEKLRCDSDSVQAFLVECCDTDRENNEWKANRSDLYERYRDYCHEYQREPYSNQNFYKSLEAKKFVQYRSSDERYFKGIRYPKSKEAQYEFVTDSLNRRVLHTVAPNRE